MNVTEFKNKILSLNLNNVETNRVNNLTLRDFKYKIKTFTNFKEANNRNYKQILFI